MGGSPLDLAALGQASLMTADGTEVKAESLWSSAPLVLLILRRPGCLLCRAEAQRLWNTLTQGPQQELGLHIACIVKEWRQSEIDAFTPVFWAGPVLHDTSMAFYKALGGGKLLKASLVSVFNPLGAFWRRVAEARKEVSEHNLVGEGMILGGLMVIGKGGKGPYLLHVESELGKHANMEDVLAACKKAAAEAPVA